MVDLNKINWTCDCCGAYLNSQEGFNTESDWVCTVCGFVNDVSLGNIKWRPGDLKAMDEEDRNEVLEAKKVFRKRKRDGYFDQPLYDEDETYDTEDTGEYLSVEDAALIWLSNGKDEDYMFGYTEEELNDAL